jgi:hypothetical protein
MCVWRGMIIKTEGRLHGRLRDRDLGGFKAFAEYPRL